MDQKSREFIQNRKETVEEVSLIMSWELGKIFEEFAKFEEANPMNASKDKNLMELFEADEEAISRFTSTVLSYFDVASLDESLSPFDLSDTLKGFVSYISFLVLDRRGLLRNSEKMLLKSQRKTKEDLKNMDEESEKLREENRENDESS